MANVYMNWVSSRRFIETLLHHNRLPYISSLYYFYQYNRGASFHYVSNSPWQLFPMLTAFFHTKKFPPGSAHLKFYNDLVKTLLDEPQRNKRDTILEILKVSQLGVCSVWRC